MASLLKNGCSFVAAAAKFLRASRHASGPEARQLLAQYATQYLHAMGLEVTGPSRQELDAIKPCILVANHTSLLDALIFVSIFDIDVRILAKAGLFKFPFLGRILRQCHHIAVYRGHQAQNMRIREDIREAIAQGACILIFPEGTRTPDGRLGPFKRGAFYNAIEVGVPIVPLLFRGTFEAMPKTTLRVKPGACSLSILAPIAAPTEGDLHQRATDYAAIVRAEMQRNLENPSCERPSC